MKYFKSPEGDVFAYEADGSQDEYIRKDLVAMTKKEVEAFLNPPLSADAVRSIIDAHMSEVVNERGYDSVLSLCTYATSTNEKFSKEGQAGVEWRDRCLEYQFSVADSIKSGKRRTLTKEKLIEGIPVINW